MRAVSTALARGVEEALAELVDPARPHERRLGRVGVAHAQRRRDVRERRGQLVEHRPRGLAQHPQRVRGEDTAATASAISPPVSASSVRANETPPVGGVIVNTSAAEIATWLTNSWLVPKNMPSPTAMNTASASCGTPVPSW